MEPPCEQWHGRLLLAPVMPIYLEASIFGKTCSRRRHMCSQREPPAGFSPPPHLFIFTPHYNFLPTAAEKRSLCPPWIFHYSSELLMYKKEASPLTRWFIHGAVAASFDILILNASDTYITTPLPPPIHMKTSHLQQRIFRKIPSKPKCLKNSWELFTFVYSQHVFRSAAFIKITPGDPAMKDLLQALPAMGVRPFQ